jgi:hypothetical protein
MSWEDRLDEWELELELNARLAGSDWVTLEHAAAETGVSRATLRLWYRTGQIPSQLVDGPHGPQRLVPLAVITERAQASPRIRHSAERRMADEAEIEILRRRVDQLELRVAAVEKSRGLALQNRGPRVGRVHCPHACRATCCRHSNSRVTKFGIQRSGRWANRNCMLWPPEKRHSVL